MHSAAHHTQGRKPDFVVRWNKCAAKAPVLRCHGELKKGKALTASDKGQVLDVTSRLIKVHGQPVWSWLLCEGELVLFYAFFDNCNALQVRESTTFLLDTDFELNNAVLALLWL